MDEAEYCDRIALVFQGRIIASGSPDALKSLTDRPDASLEQAFIELIERHVVLLTRSTMRLAAIVGRQQSHHPSMLWFRHWQLSMAFNLWSAPYWPIGGVAPFSHYLTVHCLCFSKFLCRAV